MIFASSLQFSVSLQSQSKSSRCCKLLHIWNGAFFIVLSTDSRAPLLRKLSSPKQSFWSYIWRLRKKFSMASYSSVTNHLSLANRDSSLSLVIWLLLSDSRIYWPSSTSSVMLPSSNCVSVFVFLCRIWAIDSTRLNLARIVTSDMREK